MKTVVLLVQLEFAAIALEFAKRHYNLSFKNLDVNDLSTKAKSSGFP